MKRLLKLALARAGFVVRRRPRLLVEKPELAVRFDLSYLIAHLLLRQPLPFVVQVGAYDGVANDPVGEYIRRFRLPGLLIEPQPTVFARLQNNYATQPQVSLCRAAVDGRDGTRTMYHLDPSAPGLPEWSEQTATFCKDVLLAQRGLIPDIERLVVAEQVSCRTFNTIFAEHGVTRIDLLQIDTEGYDYEMLKLFPFDRFLPLLIRYEHYHLSAADQDACLRMLAGLGYILHVPDHAAEDYMDTVAYRPEGGVIEKVGDEAHR